MKDVYKGDLDKRIQNFIGRKTRKYPELRLFEGQGQESIRPNHRSRY